MKNNNTAVERDKAGMAFELNEKFKDCKTETHEYLIGKQRCVVVRHTAEIKTSMKCFTATLLNGRFPK